MIYTFKHFQKSRVLFIIDKQFRYKLSLDNLNSNGFHFRMRPLLSSSFVQTFTDAYCGLSAWSVREQGIYEQQKITVQSATTHIDLTPNAQIRKRKKAPGECNSRKPVRHECARPNGCSAQLNSCGGKLTKRSTWPIAAATKLNLVIDLLVSQTTHDFPSVYSLKSAFYCLLPMKIYFSAKPSLSYNNIR